MEEFNLPREYRLIAIVVASNINIDITLFLKIRI